MPPTLANGKICYVEIPAIDVERSADFYAKGFGWRIRPRGDGAIAFDDATGEVSGTRVIGRPAATEVHPVVDEHGWRLGRVEDPFGHHREIGRPLVNRPPAQW
jgi:predicted enzyme related to lactoylglutathione lyase